MKKTVINERQYGLMFKNGKFLKMAGAGKYIISSATEIEVRDIKDELVSTKCDIDQLLSYKDIESVCDVVTVRSNEICIRFVNGIFAEAVDEGKHAFLKAAGENEFMIFEKTYKVAEDFPKYLFDRLPDDMYTRYSVSPDCKGVLYVNGVCKEVLDPGEYYFWNTEDVLTMDVADMRITPMDIAGQEILTADKVEVRVNLIVDYRITDPVKVYSAVANYRTYMHRAAQLAVREIVGRQKLDELLESKEEITKYVYEQMKAKCSEIAIDVVEAGVKDIILPGSVREIMNTVLIAEKKAQANVITRREEVASTRSLLNTAKLMEENPTLYKLKELEYVERICENVGNINIGGTGDILESLTKIIGRNAS